MKKFRGFLLKHRVRSLFQYVRRRNSEGFRLNQSPRSMSKFLNWGARIKTKAIALCSGNPSYGSGYLRVRQDPVPAVPKGKMAVYVGRSDAAGTGDGDFERVLVPVIYINHPLFGQLLRKSEEEYGHDYAGGLTIPCRISEFENVKTRIAAGCGCRKMLPWRRPI